MPKKKGRKMINDKVTFVGKVKKAAVKKTAAKKNPSRARRGGFGAY